MLLTVVAAGVTISVVVAGVISAPNGVSGVPGGGAGLVVPPIRAAFPRHSRLLPAPSTSTVVLSTAIQTPTPSASAKITGPHTAVGHTVPVKAAPNPTRRPAAPPTSALTQSPTPGATLTSAPKPTPTPVSPKLLFGLGSEASGALTAPIVRDAPIHLLSSWFNGTSDLAWMMGWAKNLIPAQYAAGRSLHLIVYATGSATAVTTTKYGPACGRPYPLSAQFQADMVTLAKTWAGAAGGPPLYVTLFTEFQTYACHASAWLPDDAYWQALKDAYTEAMATFHRYAPNARVSLGWGGWQTRFDNPATGGGRSMFAHFADVMAASDFQSFQAMQNDTNVADVLAMTRVLGAWGSVMLAHYKPDNASQATFDADTAAMLTDTFLRQAMAAGLFAWSFMDSYNMDADPTTYARILAAVERYGR